MKDYNKRIEEVAKNYSNNYDVRDAVIWGVNSEVAKEFHQQGMYTEEDIQSILIEYSQSSYASFSRPIKFFIEYLRKKRS